MTIGTFFDLFDLVFVMPVIVWEAIKVFNLLFAAHPLPRVYVPLRLVTYISYPVCKVI